MDRKIGYAAALKTVMKSKKSWQIITNTGNKIRNKWKKIAKKNKLKIKIYGLPSLSRFEIKSQNWIKYKTYITQEMLKSGFLASDTIYFSIAHTDQILKKYINKLEKIFAIISKCENSIEDIDDLIESQVSKLNMKRMN